MICRNRSALWGNHLFLEEINNELPLGERPPCRHEANVNFLSRKPVFSDSQKKEQPVAQHPCLDAERCLSSHLHEAQCKRAQGDDGAMTARISQPWQRGYSVLTGKGRLQHIVTLNSFVWQRENDKGQWDSHMLISTLETDNPVQRFHECN